MVLFNRAMAESLFYQGQIHVSSHQVRRKAVFEAMWVPLLGWQASGGCDCLEQAPAADGALNSSFGAVAIKQSYGS